MANNNRTLKLNILAETAALVKGLNDADKATRTAGDRIKSGFKAVGAAALAAGVAAGAYAAKLAVDGVKAAIEDEAAQIRLANALKNTTGATNEQIAAIERQILQTSLATGIADDQLRPALSRLAVATGNTAKAQDLLNLALDVSTATGKPLEAVTQALGKAYEGNTTSLSRLGVGLGAADIKALGLEGTVQQLSQTFGGAAAKQAETFEGRMARLRVAFDEAKESVGAALLPALSNLFELVTSKVVPIFQQLSDDFSKNVAPVLDRVFKIVQRDLFPVLQVLGNFILKDLVPTIRDFFRPVVDILITGIQFLINKVKENEQGFSVFLGIIQRVWQFIKDYVIPLFQTAFVTAINLVFRNIGFLIEAFTQVFEIIGKVAKFLGFDLDLALNKTTKSTNNLNSGIVDAYRSFGEQSRVVNQEVIPSLSGATGGTNALTAATNSAAAATKNLTAVQRELNALRAGGAVGAAISPDLKSFYKSELSLISQAGGFIEGINLLPTDPFYGFGKGGNVSQAISQRQSGSATATGSTTIINVNGTVIDPEGAARAIENVIQNSTDRGGGWFTGEFGLIAE